MSINLQIKILLHLNLLLNMWLRFPACQCLNVEVMVSIVSVFMVLCIHIAYSAEARIPEYQDNNLKFSE